MISGLTGIFPAVTKDDYIAYQDEGAFEAVLQRPACRNWLQAF